MTDLTELNVSLTKHGASKVADLLVEYEATEILSHVDGDFHGIDIDPTQTKKNLSIYYDETNTEIWENARSLGEESIKALVFIAIILSHHKLIEAMRKGATEKLTGIVIRNDVLNGGKEYSNFKYNATRLGFAEVLNKSSVQYDLTPIVKNSDLIPLVRDLISTKLKVAGWEEENTLIQEALNLSLNEVFSLSPSDFSSWLTGNNNFISVVEESEEEPEVKNMDFTSGHNERDEETTTVIITGGTREVNQVHNVIQNRLSDHLIEKYGIDKVGTEIDPGIGTSVDIVREDEDGNYIFYEIKTAKQVRTSIRQALPQLLEYAYWPNNNRSHKLVIVTIKDITAQAQLYLEYLRERFTIPIYYAKFDLENNCLDFR